ncbi:hypothetical protein LCGC14_2099380, partial [marine sediment metagenome]
GILEIAFTLLILLSFYGTFFIRSFRKDLICFKGPILSLVWVFILFLVFNTFVSVYNEVNMIEWFRGMAPFVLFFVSLFIVANQFRDTASVNELFFVFILSCLIYSTKGLCLLLNSPIVESGDIYISAKYETIKAQNIYQVLRVASAGLLFSVIYFSEKLTRFKSRFYIATFIVISVSILFSYSRGLMLSFLIVSIIGGAFLVKKYKLPGFLKKWNFYYFAIVSVLVIATFFIYSQRASDILFAHVSASVGSIKSLFDFSNSYSFAGRLQEHREVLSYIMDNPLMGYGLGYEIPYFLRDGSFYKNVSSTHNMISYLLLFTGAIGTAIYLWLLANIIFGLKRMARTDNSDIKGIANGLILGVMMVLIYVQFNPFFKNLSYNLFLGIVAGVAVNGHRLIQGSEANKGQ